MSSPLLSAMHRTECHCSLVDSMYKHHNTSMKHTAKICTTTKGAQNSQKLRSHLKSRCQNSNMKHVHIRGAKVDQCLGFVHRWLRLPFVSLQMTLNILRDSPSACVYNERAFLYWGVYCRVGSGFALIQLTVLFNQLLGSIQYREFLD